MNDCRIVKGNNPNPNFIPPLSKKSTKEKALQDALDEIQTYKDKIESGELIEVVRCKNCIHKSEYANEYFCARVHQQGYKKVEKEHFCSYGEECDISELAENCEDCGFCKKGLNNV